MIKIGAKRGRTSKQISLVSSSDLDVIESAVKVASIEDLVAEILLHVPIKTLMCFKSVSKQWLSIITNPLFTRLRNPLSPSLSSLFFVIPSRRRSNPNYQFIPLDVGGGTPKPFKTLNFISDSAGIYVVQSCNGLLLCASYRVNECNLIYYVYNPTTKQYSTLPQIGRENPKYVYGMSLAFDPSVSPYYKVICVRRSETSPQLFQIQVYSSGAPSWRASGEPFTAPEDMDFQGSIYWNGSVYWWSGFVHCSLSRDKPYILYFNIFKEKVEQLSMPPLQCIGEVELYGQEDVMTFHTPSYLAESEGHLHFVELHPDVPYLFNVYEMASDYSGWSVKYKFDINDISNVFTEIIEKNIYNVGDTFNILSIGTSNMVLEIPGDKVVRYNFVDKRVEELWKFNSKFQKSNNHVYAYDGLRRVCAFPYIESLACV